MKELFKNIFARIWALWALISFILSFLVIFLPAMLSYLMKEPGGQAYFLWVSRMWMNLWLHLAGCSFRITGKHNFEKGKQYVVVFNHNALLDVPLSCPYVPGPNKTIAKASFAKIPLFGWFYRKGSVLVDRSNDKSRARSFEQMKKVLSNGMHMCIYPEGTRNRTDKPQKPFYDGAFKLAVLSGKEVIPTSIRGTREAMPILKSFYFLPQKLSMEFLPPVPSEGKSVEELKEEVYQIMLNAYTKK